MPFNGSSIPSLPRRLISRKHIDRYARLFVLVIGTVTCILCFYLNAKGSQNPKQAESAATDRADSTMPRARVQMSMVSCASCHGSLSFLDSDPKDRWQSAYPIWASRDPHSGAYHSLWNEQSKQIVAALAVSSTTRHSAKRTPLTDRQHQQVINDRCIGCHSTVPANMSNEMLAQANDDRAHNNLRMSNGVSCLSCHSKGELDDPGANRWVELHTKQAWADGTIDKSAEGLVPLDDLNIRAQRCAKCHVGSKTGDVNHDLIAAGHPRLVFEYSSFLAKLPKHWDEDETSDFHVKCWSIGQLESAKTAIALLAHRAKLSLAGRAPWPEFAEYNCHNCHHRLNGVWYEANNPRQFGKPAWGTWSFPSSILGTMSEGIPKLRLEMQKAYPNPTSVVGQARPQDLVAANVSAGEHLYAYLQGQPEQNSDEVYAWYLAVYSFINDLPVESPEKTAVIKLTSKLEHLLKVPFESKTQNQPVDPDELLTLIGEIRELVLPMLLKQQNSALPKQ